MRSLKIVMLICILIYQTANAQKGETSKYPSIGDTLADHTFTDLVNYPGKQAKVSDFRGKWLILDFWNYGCGSCIASFPKMNSLSEHFKKDVQIIMVGDTKRSTITKTPTIEERIKNTYTKLDNKYHLKMTTAFDSTLVDKYDVGLVPHVMVIDPNGVLRAKLFHIDSVYVSKLTSGVVLSRPNERSFSKTEPIANRGYDLNFPLLTSGNEANGGTDTSFLFRSMLCLWNNTMPANLRITDLNDPALIKEINSTGKLEEFHWSAAALYKLSYFKVIAWGPTETNYFENFYPKLIIQSVDQDSLIEDLEGKTRYAYSLKLPTGNTSPVRIMKRLQSDLETYFGYTATVELKKVPVYLVTINDQKRFEKLISKDKDGLKPTFKQTSVEKYEYFNYPFKQFIKDNMGSLFLDAPFFLGSGFDKKVDLKFDRNLVDPEDTFKKFEAYGVKVEKTLKEMKVIVLRKV